MVVWKVVLLEKDELENGAFGNGCFWKMDFWKRVLLEHYEKKFTKLMSFGNVLRLFGGKNLVNMGTF